MGHEHAASIGRVSRCSLGAQRLSIGPYRYGVSTTAKRSAEMDASRDRLRL
jgi:hypothetical protein